MKRTRVDIEQVADPENLKLAFWKAQKGKHGNVEVEDFRCNLDKNLFQLQLQLLSGDVNVGNYHYFTIYDPKERKICAASFSERVLHHALMNVCHPIFESYQIFDSYATRKNKGTYAALDRAKQYQSKFEYFLKLDVRKFFDTISHNKLKNALRNKIKGNEILQLFYKIIDSYHTNLGRGIPIGNLTSQYFANHLLAEADHFVKEKLRVKAFVRYMDDMVLWGYNKNELLKQGVLLNRYI